ncbi:MAG: helix-turn-helix domain-containing protein [Bacteroidota bacterium]
MTATFPQLSWFFIFAFALNGLLAVSILIFRNRPFRVANLLLAINLVGFALAPIMISLVESRLILEVPHFFRLPSPIYYASFPAGYLYVRLILKDENELEWWDYLHFLPAILHLIEMTPFYLLDAESKIAHINFVLDNKFEIYAHREGWLPPFLHNILRGISAFVYAMFMWRLLVTFKHKFSVITFSSNVITWLKLFTVNNAAMGLSIIVLLTFQFIPSEVRSLALHSCLLLGLVTANFFLFFKPEILYGIPQPVPSRLDTLEVTETHHDNRSSQDSPIIEAVNSTEIPRFIFEYKDKINAFLKTTQRYLDPDFNIQDLSRETGLPRHHIQLLINKVEQKRFVEFMNEYRIDHLHQLVQQGELKRKTLETLASESGFSSKATFIRTIKKVTGKTPKEVFHPK